MNALSQAGGGSADARPRPRPHTLPRFRVSLRALLVSAAVCGVLSAFLYELARHDCARAIRATPEGIYRESRAYPGGGELSIILPALSYHQAIEMRYCVVVVGVGMLLHGVLLGAATRRARRLRLGAGVGLAAFGIAVVAAWLTPIDCEAPLALAALPFFVSFAPAFAGLEWRRGSRARLVGKVLCVYAIGAGLYYLVIPGLFVAAAWLSDGWLPAHVTAGAPTAGGFMMALNIPMAAIAAVAAGHVLLVGYLAAMLSAEWTPSRDWEEVRRALWPFEKRARTPEGVVGEDGGRLLPMRFGLKGLIAFLLFVTALHAVFFLQEPWRVTAEVPGRLMSGGAPFVTPDLSKIVTVDGSWWKLSVYDIESARKLRDFDSGERQYYFAAFSPDGRRAVASGECGSLAWDIETGRAGEPIPLAEWGATFSGRACVERRAGYDTVTGTRRIYPATPNAAVSPDGSLLAVLDSKQKEVRILELQTGALLRAVQLGDDYQLWPTDVPIRFSPDGRLLLVEGSWLSGVIVEDVRTGKPVGKRPYRWLEHRFFSRDGSIVAGVMVSSGGNGGRRGMPLVLDAGTGQRLREGLPVVSYSVQGLRDALLTFDATDGRHVWPLEGRYDFSFSPGGGLVIWRGEKGAALQFWPADERRWPSRAVLEPPMTPLAGAPSPDYRTVAVVFAPGGAVIFWDDGYGEVCAFRRRYPPGVFGHLRRIEIWAAVVLGGLWLWTVRGWLRRHTAAPAETEVTVTPPAGGTT